jgi:hypothetical protein
MSYSTPDQRQFPPLSGYTVRANFDGGALSSDFGALLLRGIDRQIGYTERLAAAVRDKRHPSYIAHTLRDLCAQRISQSAAGAWCAWWQTSCCLERSSSDTPAGPLTQKAPSIGFSRRETTPKLGSVTVYEISGLALSRLAGKCFRPGQ